MAENRSTPTIPPPSHTRAVDRSEHIEALGFLCDCDRCLQFHEHAQLAYLSSFDPNVQPALIEPELNWLRLNVPDTRFVQAVQVDAEGLVSSYLRPFLPTQPPTLADSLGIYLLAWVPANPWARLALGGVLGFAGAVALVAIGKAVLP